MDRAEYVGLADTWDRAECVGGELTWDRAGCVGGAVTCGTVGDALHSHGTKLSELVL
jgi:hypothetical protein